MAASREGRIFHLQIAQRPVIIFLTRAARHASERFPRLAPPGSIAPRARRRRGALRGEEAPARSARWGEGTVGRRRVRDGPGRPPTTRHPTARAAAPSTPLRSPPTMGPRRPARWRRTRSRWSSRATTAPRWAPRTIRGAPSRGAGGVSSAAGARGAATTAATPSRSPPPRDRAAELLGRPAATRATPPRPSPLANRAAAAVASA